MILYIRVCVFVFMCVFSSNFIRKFRLLSVPFADHF